MAPFPYCLSIWVTANSTALPLLGSTFVSAFVSPFVIESPFSGNGDDAVMG
jgi:hypothetical protein